MVKALAFRMHAIQIKENIGVFIAAPCNRSSCNRPEAKAELVKRGKTWHAHFFVDGQRFRQSLETSDWREAQAKEKELMESKAGRKRRKRDEA
jgi:hypothetical protein